MAGQRHLLMHEDFSGLRPGLVKEADDGAYREMHARAAHPDDNLDGRQRKAGHWGLPADPWLCVETPQGRRLQSTANATVADNVSIAKGDFGWQDYQVESAIAILDNSKQPGWGGPVGVLFRFLDSQRYYAAVIDRDGMAKLARRIVGHWDVLAAAPIGIEFNTPILFRVSCRGDTLHAQIGAVKLEANDAEFPVGMAGFIGARPAVFGPLKVTCTSRELKRLREARGKQHRLILAGRRQAAQPVLWRKLSTEGFGSGRRIRLGDLNGDGQLEIVFPRVDFSKAGPKDIDCLTAMTLDGKVLWQIGRPPPAPKAEYSADTPVQIQDIDGDGNAEVVAVMNRQIMVLDGKTGRAKYAASVPKVEKLPSVYKSNINEWGGGYGDETDEWPVNALAFADLTGTGSRRDLLLLDNYHHTIALDSTLRRELWRVVNPHGHFPLPVDLDGDGRDSVMLGYRHVNCDGTLLGRVCLEDHQDAIFCGPLDDDGKGPYEVLMAAGEDGLLRLTPDYDIYQRVMGHVQRLAIGKFRADRRGQCVATVLFHGNRGIVSLFDATLMRIWTKDFPVVGATLQPVLFDASGVEYMFLSAIRPAQGHQGGLINGQGDLVVPLPDDGGPGLCAFAYDLDRDGLDELITWDHERMWIYHSNADCDPSRLPKRTRPPLYNMSNFQSYYSLPGGVKI
ncbi:MAG: hypothetical protein NTW87_08230 [Planctomycetota bacterium]|nr:hypothetical protein [Planctomycetota bacterium]